MQPPMVKPLNGLEELYFFFRAIKTGMRTLRMEGASKVVKGMTTADEVMRVTQMDTF